MLTDPFKTLAPVSNVRCVLPVMSQDNTIRCFDLETGAHVRTLVGHKGWVTALIFVKRHLISASNDGSVGAPLNVWEPTAAV